MGKGGGVYTCAQLEGYGYDCAGSCGCPGATHKPTSAPTPSPTTDPRTSAPTPSPTTDPRHSPTTAPTSSPTTPCLAHDGQCHTHSDPGCRGHWMIFYQRWRCVH